LSAFGGVSSGHGRSGQSPFASVDSVRLVLALSAIRGGTNPEGGDPVFVSTQSPWVLAAFKPSREPRLSGPGRKEGF
jgi:hypothetical protein